MTRSILIFVITLLIGGLQSVSAQVSFAKDKLYNIFPASQPEKVIAYQKGMRNRFWLPLVPKTSSNSGALPTCRAVSVS